MPDVKMLDTDFNGQIVEIIGGTECVGFLGQARYHYFDDGCNNGIYVWLDYFDVEDMRIIGPLVSDDVKLHKNED